MAQAPRTHEDYLIGIVCALAFEKDAMVTMLDETHPKLNRAIGDENNYTLGRIGAHNVVIACILPGWIEDVASIATNMMRSFPIRLGLVVGVGGGVWSKKNDIRLGDIVVSHPTSTHGGVSQWDFGKIMKDGMFQRTGSLNGSPALLRSALDELRTFDITDGIDIKGCLALMVQNRPAMSQTYQYQGVDYDQLFVANYDHIGYGLCDECDHRMIVQRPARQNSNPRVHYGNIATGNQLMRHGATRDKVAKKEDIICFEVEGAGLMNQFPCLVIKGICDYADSHDNTIWRPYAAATAAAFARLLLGFVDQLGEPAIGPTTAIGMVGGAESLLQRQTRHLTRNSDNNELTHAIPALGQPVLPVPHCKMCHVLYYLWISLAATSFAIGLWRSLATSDEGKGFTDAAYVIAVGGVVLSPIQNRHTSKCRLNKQ